MSEPPREQRMLEISLEASTQATAGAKASRSSRAKTAPLDQSIYRDGDLVDYHWPTTTTDDWGYWSGPCPVARNAPEKMPSKCVARQSRRRCSTPRPKARTFH
eukprot:38744-Pyramimonas_sp.AAC.1